MPLAGLLRTNHFARSDAQPLRRDCYGLPYEFIPITFRMVNLLRRTMIPEAGAGPDTEYMLPPDGVAWVGGEIAKMSKNWR